MQPDEDWLNTVERMDDYKDVLEHCKVKLVASSRIKLLLNRR